MMEHETGQMSDLELAELKKKKRSADLINAVFIGFLIGIVIYSIIGHRFTIFTLIPLYFAYKAIKNGANYKTPTKEKSELK